MWFAIVGSAPPRERRRARGLLCEGLAADEERLVVAEAVGRDKLGPPIVLLDEAGVGDLAAALA